MSGSARFVIQKHSRKGGDPHWDLMLETGDCLDTYRVDTPPQHWPQKPATATHIFDHPLKFLTYQGSVNNGEGLVEIADAGKYEVMNAVPDIKQIRFEGNIVRGQFVLVHIEGEKWELNTAEKTAQTEQ